MMLKNQIALVVFIFLCFSYGNAQTVFQPKPVDYNLKGVLYDFESLYEFRIHTQGFAVGYKKGRVRSYYRTTYQNFEFGYVKDGRERRANRNLSISGNRISAPFIYGKANQFFTFRYSYGEKKFLSEKTRRKGLAVGIIYEGGATIGLSKPYTLQLIRSESDDPTTRFLEKVSYTDEVADEFLNDRILYGGTNFFQGWTKVSPTVGLHGKVGMQWAFGAFEQQAKAVETGIMVDIFPQNVPLLIERDDIKNSFYYIKLYVAFQFGDRKRLGE